MFDAGKVATEAASVIIRGNSGHRILRYCLPKQKRAEVNHQRVEDTPSCIMYTLRTNRMDRAAARYRKRKTRLEPRISFFSGDPMFNKMAAAR